MTGLEAAVGVTGFTMRLDGFTGRGNGAVTYGWRGGVMGANEGTREGGMGKIMGVRVAGAGAWLCSGSVVSPGLGATVSPTLGDTVSPGVESDWGPNTGIWCGVTSTVSSLTVTWSVS